ncbi:hypothetical protein NP590_07230 [Methylomonas sp. SURF-2]|uniref:Uncharacterized protein n=1 Tax=Methylomonas subterranea TaxID=2952225 RepID=A0ABT1TFP7_9GAMM|nr:hypothetical protein [Methylomonas sp. SURF-2]MCQ8103892.1 hypothetical protein [Methylomonas sp. SURF-2]
MIKFQPVRLVNFRPAPTNKLILNPGQTRRQAKRDKFATPQAEKPEPAATQAADKAKGLVWNPNCNKEDLI